MKLERPQAPLQSIKQRLRQFDVVSVWTEPFDALLQPDDVPIDLGDVPIRQGKTLTVAGLIHSQDGSTDMRTALGQSPRPQSRRACVGTPVSKACVRPRARREAGAQLAARQLNCESVFRGMLNYGRERNNAPAGFVAARPASTTRQLAPFASQRPSLGRQRDRSRAPFASPLVALLT